MRIVKNEIQRQTKAKRLTIKWYKTLVHTYDVVCLSFYANWARGDQSGDFGAEYDKAAQIIEKLYPRERHKKGTAIMVKVNCSDEKQLATMFDVYYYPTFKMIKNGQLLETVGPKTFSAEYFLQFLEQHICEKDKVFRYPVNDTSHIFLPCYIEKLALEYYSCFIREYDFVVLFFYKAASQQCKIAWHVFHEAYRELTKVYITTYENPQRKTPEVVFAALDCDVDKTIAKYFKIYKFPVFKLIRNGINFLDYDYDGSIQGFVNFVTSHKGSPKTTKYML